MESRPVEHLSEHPHITLLHLRCFTGDDSAFLTRIPAQTAGVYAWYQAFSFRNDPAGFREDLLRAMLAPKFADRSGKVGPTHRVTLSSGSSPSASKQQLIDNAIETPAFRELLQAALALNVFFQSPLYIGRASDLRVRIGQHLRADGPLRSRLESIHIDLRACSLLYIPLPDALEALPEGDAT